MHALLNEVGIMESKSSLLEGYGVEHTTELTDQDLVHLVDRLTNMKHKKESFQDADKKRWRSNLLSLLNKYGLYVTNDDWTQVNAFLLNKKIGGKILYEMNVEELQSTCLRLRIILSKRQQIMQHNDQLAKLN